MFNAHIKVQTKIIISFDCTNHVSDKHLPITGKRYHKKWNDKIVQEQDSYISNCNKS